ncbi:MAG: PstS family phosphate ABC transporter substrate-binding protein [Bauldia sp.]|nr:PstS family phosphate ABC transporter substrate-binding protein [Bauldia sp.]
MKLNKIGVAAVALATTAVATVALAQVRDQIRVVGSSTVFPYSQAVAEEFANLTGSRAPIVESTGTGGGFQVFCAGIGPSNADVTGASRAIKASEYELCVANGVTDITELQLGYDGLSIAVSRASTFDWNLTEAQIFQALAAEVEVDGAVVPNPYTNWSQIDPSLPDVTITVFGPPPTSGTRDAFVELAMHDGCAEFPAIQALEAARRTDVCSRMRQDGPFVEAGENDNLIVQRIISDPTTIGIFGYSFLYENSDTLKAVAVEGIVPTFETIADFSYAIARPIFIYVKNQHRGVIPGLDDFVAEFVSDAALAPGGYLAERGLTPLSDELRAEMQDRALNAVTMDPAV